MESILYNLILYYSNILIGIGISIVLTFIIACAIIVLFKPKQATVLTFVFAVITLPFIAFQISRAYGAFELSSTVDALATTADVITSTVEENILANDDVLQATEFLSEFVPGVSDITEGLRDIIATGQDAVANAHDYINNYIIRRLLWTLLFLVISIVGMCFSMNNDSKTASIGSRRTRSLHRERHTNRTGRNHRY